MTMIQANDLRIGNYYDHNGEFRKATPETILEVWKAERTWCNPIPLTEEILLKCGFEKLENNWKRFCICNDWTYIYWERLAGLELSVNKHSVMLPHIKYLHQLQNLIHALTNTELNITL